MDISTIEIIKFPDISIEQNISTILLIYNKYKEQENSIILKTVEDIFSDIDELYYNNTFKNVFLVSDPVSKRVNINYKDTGINCEETEAFISAMEYDDSDEEIKEYDYGFHLALQCINSIKGEKLYYSGGYITKSKLIFIILMLLHETIHIIEYKDSLLTKSDNEHTSFFFKYAYKRFKMISRLSEMLDNTDLLRNGSTTRIELINTLDYDISDGTDVLNDHSSYMKKKKQIPLGYIVHDIFRRNGKFICIEDIPMKNGGKRKTMRNKRKKIKLQN
jgi:hypothetical protein